MAVWTKILDSMPGLLCCVINLQGKLLYTTQGYKAVALRMFGHKCINGENYPPMSTDFDNELHGILVSACTGQTNAVEFNENNKVWNITASPLRIDDEQIRGVIIRITYGHEIVKIIKNPDVLNSLAMRAAVTDPKGKCIAVNKFFYNELKPGRHVQDLIDQPNRFNLVKILGKRSGEIECRMKNFETDDFMRVKIHAGPIEWQDNIATLITVEDVTDFNRTREQLRRILTQDNALGILNRQGLEHFIMQEMRKNIKNGVPLSVVAIKLKGIGGVNEREGYFSGDEVINSFSENLQDILKGRQCTSGRWSGGDFLVITNLQLQKARLLAGEIRERAILPGSVKIYTGASEFNEADGMSVNDLVARAYDDINGASRV